MVVVPSFAGCQERNHPVLRRIDAPGKKIQILMKRTREKFKNELTCRMDDCPKGERRY